MRHSLTVQGFGLRLRPVRIEDAAFIVWLRNLDHVKGWVGDSAADVSSQEKWLDRYFEREDDYYFIIETSTKVPLGTHGMYDFTAHCAEIGRIAIRPGTRIGLAASLLLLDLFYGQMGMTQVRARSLAGNHRAQALLRKLGLNQVRVERAGTVIGGEKVDVLHFSQLAEQWFCIREKLIPKGKAGEADIRKWEEERLKNKSAMGPENEY